MHAIASSKVVFRMSAWFSPRAPSEASARQLVEAVLCVAGGSAREGCGGNLFSFPLDWQAIDLWDGASRFAKRICSKATLHSLND